MRKCIVLLSSVLLLCLLTANGSFAADPLIQPGDLIYMGAFRVPQGGSGCSGFQYGGDTVAYNPTNNSLFMTGQQTNATGCTQFAEISIPTPKCLDGNGNVVSCSGYVMPSPPTDYLGNLNTASFLQNFVDDTYGNEANVSSPPAVNGTNNDGLLVYNGKLIGSTKIYYDAGRSQTATTFTNSTTLSTNNFSGYYTLNSGLFPGYDAGPMTLIPSAYQSQLGGTVITGQGPGNGIITTCSAGPAAIVYDPANLTSSNLPPNTVPATALVWYDTVNHTITGGGWSQNLPANPLISPSDLIKSVVFPDNTRTVLYFGEHGTAGVDGHACYGDFVGSLSQAYGDGCPGGVGNCSFSQRLSMSTGSVTSGTFIPGETIQSSASSHITAKLSSVGSGRIYFLTASISGSYSGSQTAGVTWTGLTSGAVFTQSGGSYVKPQCYNPPGVGGGPGPTAYPVENYVWAYDVGNPDGTNTPGNNVSSLSPTNPGENNLTAVKLGLIKPYQIVPYATWRLVLPTANSNGKVVSYISGAAWDSARRLIYVTQVNTDNNGSVSYPIVHVFSLSTSVSGTSTSPLPSPSGLRLMD